MSKSSHEPNLHPALRRWPLAITGLGATALLAACGLSATGSTAGSSTSSPGSPGSPTPTPAATPSVSCAQVTALRVALTQLINIRVNATTGRQISADLTNVDNAFTPIKNETNSAFSAEASQISAALTTIGKHAQALSSHPSPANLRATTTAIRELKAAAGPVIAIMRTDCPSS